MADKCTILKSVKNKCSLNKGAKKLDVPKEIYEIIDYINSQKHAADTKELFFAIAERGIEQGNNGFKSSDLLGGEGFSFTDITGSD